MEFEFKVSNLVSKVDALIMKDLQFKKDCNKSIKLLNEKVVNYNEKVVAYNGYILDKAEAQLEGVSDHGLMLDLTEVTQNSRGVPTLFSWKNVPYSQRTLKKGKEIQKTVSYMKDILVKNKEYYYCREGSYLVRTFKYNTRYYNLWDKEIYEDIEVGLYIYLEPEITLIKEISLKPDTRLQSIKDKLALAKKYDVENITLGEVDLETLTFFENHVYRDDTLCWEDMYKNEKVLKFIEENTNGK